jgi:glycosyltransferase involved in cell wall biosynthesis
MAPPLIAAGVDLHVAYLVERAGLDADLRAAGAELHRVRGRRRFDQARSFRRLIRRIEPDLVHTTLTEADVIGRVAAGLERVPCVSSLVNVQYGPESFADPNVARWKLRGWQLADALSARTVSRFHAVSQDVAEVMAKRLAIPRSKIDVVPRGRDPSQLGSPTPGRRASIRARLGLAGDEVLLAIGRQEFQKGFDVLLEAVGRIRRSRSGSCLRLLIAGRQGSETATMDRSIQQLGLTETVRLLGHRSDVPELLCGSDVFILPSRREGSPGALIEAMAMGVPSVASDLVSVREVAGCPPVVRLVPPEDPDALAREVESVLSSPHRSASLGARARERFLGHYTLESMSSGMLAFYERSLAESSGAR